jgi:cysteine desulfurase/selenocysteine lyase
MRTFDVAQVRKEFPILREQIHGKPLIYFDSAATAQKPQAVLDTLAFYYQHQNANVHRGVHELSDRATTAYEGAREKVARFLGASSPSQCVFVRGATEGINLVAHSFAEFGLKAGDQVVITEMEHHSNIVPWLMLRDRIGIELVVVPVNAAGELEMAAFKEAMTPKVKLASLNWVSNALGTINPVGEMIALAKAHQIPVMLDACQAAPHEKIDVQALGCDFLVMSGHKLYGPTGIGVVYAAGDWWDRLPPWQGGGDMIASVSFERAIWAKPPYKFEAGTPNIAGAVALGAAIDWFMQFDLSAIAAHEKALHDAAMQGMRTIEGLRFVGTAAHKAAVISFVMEVEDAHPNDIGALLDMQGIAIRSGHHCAMPVLKKFCVPATARASFGLYNTLEEVEFFVNALSKIARMFRIN